LRLTERQSQKQNLQKQNETSDYLDLHVLIPLLSIRHQSSKWGIMSGVLSERIIAWKKNFSYSR
jgi:hypothetical protein